jgi:hypothetical protein
MFKGTISAQSDVDAITQEITPDFGTSKIFALFGGVKFDADHWSAL